MLPPPHHAEEVEEEWGEEDTGGGGPGAQPPGPYPPPPAARWLGQAEGSAAGGTAGPPASATRSETGTQDLLPSEVRLGHTPTDSAAFVAYDGGWAEVGVGVGMRRGAP